MKGDPRIGLALGSGAARGWAHIGVLRELQDRGVTPGVVAGTSMGAVVGAAYASNKLEGFEDWARSLDRRAVLGFFDVSLRGGLIEARRIFDYLREHLPDTPIEELPIRYGAVATALDDGREVWLDKGSLHAAIRASAALPGLVAPSRVEDRWVVDGGLINPVPVSLCRRLGAEVIIAVDLNTTLVSKPSTTQGAARTRAFNSSLDDIVEQVRKRLSLESQNHGELPPSIYDVLTRSVAIMQLRITRSRMAGDPPDLHVLPRFDRQSWLEFDRAAEAIEEGRRALARALEGREDVLSQRA